MDGQKAPQSSLWFVEVLTHYLPLPTAWKFSGVNDMLSVRVCSVLSPKGAGTLTSDRNKPLSPIRDQHSFDCLV